MELLKGDPDSSRPGVKSVYFTAKPILLVMWRILNEAKVAYVLYLEPNGNKNTAGNDRRKGAERCEGNR